MNYWAAGEYHRYSAVLREDSNRYAQTPTKRPRGNVSMEVTGNTGVLNCSIRNLRSLYSQDRYAGYGLWIVREEKGDRIPVYAGIIQIDGEGVGESTISFVPDNVGGSGLGIESFNVLEVCVSAAPDGLPGDRVLVGELELEEADLSEEPKMEKVTPFGAGLPYHQWWKFYPGYFHNLMFNIQGTQNAGSERAIGSPETNLPDRVYGGTKNSVIETAPRVCSQAVSDVGIGPVFRGHQLVGLQYEKDAVRFLVHGIPGRFCLRDQPYGGATGYIYWHPLPGQQYKAGDYGYWLIYIDPTTGEVVLPNKTVKAPDCSNCKRDLTE